MSEVEISFSPFQREHLSLYYQWAKRPHIQHTWFRDGYASVTAIEKKLSGQSYDVPFIIQLNSKPIGYIQYCDLGAYNKLQPRPSGAFRKANAGDFCIDLFIGDLRLLNQGLGAKIVRQFSSWLSRRPDCKAIYIDPAIENQRAIQCYRKANFYPIRKTAEGVEECLIMQYAHPLQIQIDRSSSLKLFTPKDSFSLFYTIDQNRSYLTPFLEWVEKTRNSKDSELFIEMMLREFCAGQMVSFGIMKGQACIGSIGLHNMTPSTARIGYWIAKAEQGQGIITRGVRALMRYFHQYFNIQSFEIVSAPINDRSQEVAKRLQFHFSHQEPKATYYNQDFVDAVVYRYDYT